jgi:hypothetical protein
LRPLARAAITHPYNQQQDAADPEKAIHGVTSWDRRYRAPGD